MKIRRAGLMSPSGKAVVVSPVHANVGVQDWYNRQLNVMIAEMNRDARAVILPAACDTPPIIATDATYSPPAPTHAGVMFQCGARILLLKRNDDTGWAFPGGGIEDGESPEDAARREVFEETGYAIIEPMIFWHVQEWRGVGFATFTVRVEKEFIPTLNYEHADYLWIRPESIRSIDLHPGVFHTLFCGGHAADSGLAMDVAPTKQLQMALTRWGNKWIKKFDLMSDKLSLEFAQKSQFATQTAMLSAFKVAGFTVAFKPTLASIEAYKAVAAEQVGLIKSIAQKYHTDIQAQVWESVKRGGSMKVLSDKLEHTYGVTRKRAALIARDQNRKAKAVMEAVRHQELGIRQAIWMHSHGGKVPRPTHVAMNNKLYELAVGMWDSHEREYVHPGQLINCRCTMRPYIPGFETVAYPEWEIAQT